MSTPLYSACLGLHRTNPSDVLVAEPVLFEPWVQQATWLLAIILEILL